MTVRDDDKFVTYPDGFVFFWKAWPSQWFPSRFEVGGVMYSCCEQYMMAEKARVFGDEQVLQKILAATSPREQKALGRDVRNFDMAVWNSVCRGIVYSANLAKFQQHRDLAALLAATGTRTIVETSPVDAIWGIGLAADHADAAVPERWPGTNWLGIALMQVRAALAGLPLPGDEWLRPQLLKRAEHVRNGATG